MSRFILCTLFSVSSVVETLSLSSTCHRLLLSFLVYCIITATEKNSSSYNVFTSDMRANMKCTQIKSLFTCVYFFRFWLESYSRATTIHFMLHFSWWGFSLQLLCTYPGVNTVRVNRSFGSPSCHSCNIISPSISVLLSIRQTNFHSTLVLYIILCSLSLFDKLNLLPWKVVFLLSCHLCVHTRVWPTTPVVVDKGEYSSTFVFSENRNELYAEFSEVLGFSVKLSRVGSSRIAVIS